VASSNFLAEIEISFRLKKGIVMAENERGGKMNQKRMSVTEWSISVKDCTYFRKKKSFEVFP
jgi:hypothetical protein